MKQLMLKVKMARFKKAVRKLPEIKIPEKIRQAAEKQGHKFN